MNFCGEMNLRPSMPNFRVWLPLIQVTLSVAWYKFWIANCGALGSGPTFKPAQIRNRNVGKFVESGKERLTAHDKGLGKPVKTTRNSLVTVGVNV